MPRTRTRRRPRRRILLSQGYLCPGLRNVGQVDMHDHEQSENFAMSRERLGWQRQCSIVHSSRRVGSLLTIKKAYIAYVLDSAHPFKVSLTGNPAATILAFVARTSSNSGHNQKRHCSLAGAALRKKKSQAVLPCRRKCRAQNPRQPPCRKMVLQTESLSPRWSSRTLR